MLNSLALRFDTWFAIFTMECLPVCVQCLEYSIDNIDGQTKHEISIILYADNDLIHSFTIKFPIPALLLF